MRFRIPLFLLAACAVAACADGPGWTFGIDGSGRFGLVSAVSDGAASLAVPSEREGEPVRAIGADAFAACDGLVEVVLPASVEWIDPCAFAGCSSLERILVEEGCAEYVSCDGVLFDGTGTYLLNCPEGRSGKYVVPAGTVEIDAGAFSDCAQLSSVAIPVGVARAGANAFSGCTGLETLLLPAGSPCKPAAMGVPGTCRIVRYETDGLDDPYLPPLLANAVYAVVFHDPAGNGKAVKQKFRYGERKALAAKPFSRYGFVLVGWAKKKGGSLWLRDGQKVRNLTKVAGKKIPLYAVWAVRKYKVAFVANGGAGAMSSQSFVYGKAQNLRANAFRRKGHLFAGWARKPSAEATIADRQSIKALTAKGGAVKLYAKWQANRYTVRFDPNGGTGTMAAQPFVYGKWKKLRANAFEKKGLHFIGWSTKKDATRPTWKNAAKIRNLTAKNGKTVVLYAVWAKPNDPNRILCIGDSITQGYACAGLPYPARFAKLTGRTVVNRGVGGETARQGFLRAEREILSARAGTVCILFGSNDAIHGDNPLATKENLRGIIRLCRDFDCTPVLGTPPHQSGRHAQFDKRAYLMAVAIRALAREEGVAVADANVAFGHWDGYLNSNDGLHLSDAGGDLLARLFRNAL